MLQNIQMLPFSVTKPLTQPRQYIGMDLETDADDPEVVQELVCMSLHYGGCDYIYDARDAPLEFARQLACAIHYKTPMVMHFARGDLAVMLRRCPALFPLIERALNENAIECTFNGVKMDAIARGEYYKKQRLRHGKITGFGLQPSCQLFLARELVKDATRTSYGKIKHIPISQWERRFIDYALQDARAVHDLRVAMDVTDIMNPAAPGYYCYTDLPAQTRSDFSLMLARWTGLRTDGPRVDSLIREIIDGSEKALRKLVEVKFYRPARYRPVAKDIEPPSCDTKVLKDYIRDMCARKGIAPVMTADTSGGKKRKAEGSENNISLSEAALDTYGSDPLLDTYISYKKAEKRLSFLAILGTGAVKPIHSEPNNLVANGRTSWGSEDEEGNKEITTLNPQQLPRQPGVRECFIPPRMHWYWSIDYGSLELCTVAQACLWLLGKSRLAEMLNQGIPMHDTLATMCLAAIGINMTPEEFVQFKKDRPEDIIAYGLTAGEFRDAAKRGNFGFWGGMGPDRFIEANFELKLPRDAVVALRKTWREMLPEVNEYFYLIDRIVKNKAQFIQLTSGRIRTEDARGGNNFCEFANTVFSGLAADGAKDAMWRITQEMYSPVHRDSPLFGSRMCAFVHDEYQGWSHESVASAAALRVKSLAEQTMQARIPDVKIKCSVALMRRLRKGAEATYDHNGNLIPWEDGPQFKKLLAEGKVLA